MGYLCFYQINSNLHNFWINQFTFGKFINKSQPFDKSIQDNYSKSMLQPARQRWFDGTLALVSEL